MRREKGNFLFLGPGKKKGGSSHPATMNDCFTRKEGGGSSLNQTLEEKVPSTCECKEKKKKKKTAFALRVPDCGKLKKKKKGGKKKKGLSFLNL